MNDLRCVLWVLFIFCAVSGVDAQTPLNVADPNVHPYADPSLGREKHKLQGETVNEARLYDFYARQADYYRERGAVPSLLPAFPGLDAGQHGHWGLHNQNDYSDNRRNEMDHGNVFAENYLSPELSQVKAVHLRLGDSGQIGAMFDPTKLSYRAVWGGDGDGANTGGIHFPPRRWGLTQGALPIGPSLMGNNDQPGWSVGGRWLEPIGETSTRYLGYYRYEDKTVFHYRVGGVVVLDHPALLHGDGEPVIKRLITLTPENPPSKTDNPPVKTRLMVLPEGAAAQPTQAYSSRGTRIYRVFQHGERRWVCAVWGSPSDTIELADDHTVVVSLTGKTQSTSLYQWAGDVTELDAVLKRIGADSFVRDLHAMTRGGAPQWSAEMTLVGQRGRGDGPYVVDKLPVPFDNASDSMMMLSGIDFFPNGDAAVCTLMGDVWRVSGIDDSLRSVTWRRIGAGLHQPFGLKIFDGRVHVMGRDQITVLNDLNADGETDYYENFINDYFGLAKSHTHSFGLDRDRDGNWYYIVGEFVCKKPAGEDRSEVIARGFRNAMGYGLSADGVLLVAPQEGQWTPASMIIEIHDDEFYGYTRSPGAVPEIAPAMCYVPRGVDNSTGGMLFVDSERWGPFNGQVVVFSYGAGTHYVVLRDAKDGNRSQGAVVPLEGEFVSGVNRGRFSPKDGQLYVVGSQGWGNYAVEDGCLQRVRYTGRPVFKPVGFEVFYNGVRVDFSESLDLDTAENIESYLCQQWNYEYAKRYGSPEFSVNQPDKLGHDVVPIHAARLMNNARSIFLEIPELKPVMQLYIRMHLKSADGQPFAADLFPTVLRLGAPVGFEGMAPLAADKPARLSLPIEQEDLKGASANVKGDTEPSREVDRTLVLKALGGMKYDQTEMRARAGEYVALRFDNTDVMPHNVVVTLPGAFKKVGMASFKMLNDPKAGNKHYVPDLPEVLAHTAVINPAGEFTVYFQLPDTPGRYPFLCTFPGHWQLMRGELIVE